MLKLKDYLSDDGKLDLSILNLTSVPNVNEIVRSLNVAFDFDRCSMITFQLALRKVKSIDLSNNQIEFLPACIPRLAHYSI
jgi:hypothetical protein